MMSSEDVRPIGHLAGAPLVSAGEDGVDIQIGDPDGVPLAELDMTGAPPSELVFAGPDRGSRHQGRHARHRRIGR